MELLLSCFLIFICLSCPQFNKFIIVAPHHYKLEARHTCGNVWLFCQKGKSRLILKSHFEPLFYSKRFLI